MPPTISIYGSHTGTFGAKPFTGIQWVMYCGEKDPDPDKSGCPGMNAAKDWVSKYGATIKLFIDDPLGDHGGFMTNPVNVNAAMAVLAPLVSVTAVEFYHAGLGHYFLTADQTMLGRAWIGEGVVMCAVNATAAS